MPPAVEAQCPNYWTTREAPRELLFFFFTKYVPVFFLFNHTEVLMYSKKSLCEVRNDKGNESIHSLIPRTLIEFLLPAGIVLGKWLTFSISSLYSGGNE